MSKSIASTTAVDKNILVVISLLGCPACLG